MAAMAAKLFTVKAGTLELQRLAATFIALDRLVVTDRLADFVRRFLVRANDVHISPKNLDHFLRRLDQPHAVAYSENARTVLAGIERLFFISPFESWALIQAVHNENTGEAAQLLRRYSAYFFERYGVGMELLGAEPLRLLIAEHVLKGLASPYDQDPWSTPFDYFLRHEKFLLGTSTNATKGELHVFGQEAADGKSWVDVARAQFCNVLSAGTGHDALGKAVNSLNHTSRFFAWCVKNRIYKLADVTLDDMRRLALELQPKGWFSALNTEAELSELVRRCEDDKALLLQVASSHDGATCSISSVRLSSYLGYVVTSREYPMFLRKEIAGLMQKVTVGAERRSDDMQPWSEASFKNCFGAMNGLCILPATLDRLSFEPFANARLHARLGLLRMDFYVEGITGEIPK